MSNATDTPRQPGQRRRRRSRGGKNRNNQNRNQNPDSPKRSQGNAKGGDQAMAGSRSSTRRPRTRRQPVKLTWWQKLLKTIGLYKEPSRGKVTKSRPTAKTEEPVARAPKSNTRNARGRDTREKPSTGRDERRRGGDPSTVESSRVYVGNLSYEATEQDIKELFKGIGSVRRVEIVYNRNTHRSKGYGFVEMMNKEDAIRSVEVLHDQPFMGRNMTVSGAKSPAQEQDEDMESPAQIKASDVALAPLPDPEPMTPGASVKDEPASAPEAEQPEAEQPEAEQPEAEQPEAEQPEAEQPEAEQPEAEQPEAEQPEAEQPEAEQPEAEQPEADPAGQDPQEVKKD